jgi:hypothetical protein
MRSSVDALRLKLWDQERGCLVRYPRRTRSGEARADRAFATSRAYGAAPAPVDASAARIGPTRSIGDCDRSTATDTWPPSTGITSWKTEPYATTR